MFLLARKRDTRRRGPAPTLLWQLNCELRFVSVQRRHRNLAESYHLRVP